MSTDQLEFYRNEAGTPSARGKDQRLATWLQTDVQGSGEIAIQLESLLNDASFRGEITGNAHTVTVSRKTVTIESLFDEEMPARRLARHDMLQVIRSWLNFIK